VNDILELFQRLSLPSWWERNNVNNEYASEWNDTDGMTLEQLFRQKFPHLMQQYQHQDNFQRFGPAPFMSPAEEAWRARSTISPLVQRNKLI
jgi:hypothetical protein